MHTGAQNIHSPMVLSVACAGWQTQHSWPFCWPPASANGFNIICGNLST